MRVFCLSLVLLGQAVATTEEQDTNREIMWSKLDRSHDVLDALVLEDFESLEVNAEDLELLADATDAYVLRGDHRTRLATFRRAAAALKEAARARDASAGALAYWEMTLSCVRCHRALGVDVR